jgi:peptidoglycan/LPS O-acetylase OafA/YrhL
MNVSIVPGGWSIGVEMIFYFCFPIFILFLRSTACSTAALCMSLLVLHACQKQIFDVSKDVQLYFWTNFITNLSYFMCGLVGHSVFKYFQAQPYRKNAALILLLAGMTAGLAMVVYGPSATAVFSNKTVPAYFVLGWGFAFSAVVTSQALSPVLLFDNKITLFLGKISFSLYLAHPLIIFSLPVIPKIGALPLNANIKLFLYCAFGLLSSAAAGTLLYKWIEAPAQEIGREKASKRYRKLEAGVA